MTFTHRHRSRLLATLTGAVLTLAAVGGAADARGVRPATYSGTNGPLVYYATIGTPPNMSTKLMASTISGTEVKVDLTISTVPEFSPDGTKVVWMEAGGSSWAIRMANSNGTNIVTVANGTGSPMASDPTFSPDGTKIALSYDNDIHIVSAAASQTIGASNREVDSTGMGISAGKPKYISATKIAYVGGQSGSPCTTFYPGIYVKDIGTAGVGTLLTNSCNDNPNRTYAMDMDVSPDGQWIVYKGTATATFVGLIKTDNTGSRIVAYAGTSYSDGPGTPTFSPDGTKIAFSRGTTDFVTATFDGSTVGTPSVVTFPAGVRTPSEVAWAPASAVLSAAAATTTTAAPTTTAAASAPKSDTTATGKYATATPGVTVTDNKVYNQAPAEVADDSAIRVLSIAQNKTLDVETRTPSVCLPNDDELVFLNEGKCIATIVNAKTRAVLRTVKTTVVSDDISEVKVGNSIVTLAPVYFRQMSSFLDAKARARIASIKKQVDAAGSVLVVGYSGTLNGNSTENRALSRARAVATVNALRLAGATGPFAVSGVGALDPVTRGTSEADQARNRRVVIVLIP